MGRKRAGRDIAIIGAAETSRLGVIPDMSQIQLHADAALNAGDLAGAVSALDHLPEPAASTAAPWLDDARARLTLDRTVASLEARVVAIFATGEAEGRP